MNATEYARQMFENIFKPNIKSGGIVPLAEYATQADYEECIPFDDGNAVSWYERRRRVTELAELIEIEGGCKSIFVQINPPEYFQWLGDRENSNSIRKEFIGWLLTCSQ